jgi:hypothetical protein
VVQHGGLQNLYSAVRIRSSPPLLNVIGPDKGPTPTAGRASDDAPDVIDADLRHEALHAVLVAAGVVLEERIGVTFSDTATAEVLRRALVEAYEALERVTGSVH